MILSDVLFLLFINNVLDLFVRCCIKLFLVIQDVNNNCCILSRCSPIYFKIVYIYNLSVFVSIASSTIL